MNNIKKWAACACMIASLAPANANADSLKDLFNSDWGKKLGQIAEETVAQNTAKKLEVADLKGTLSPFAPRMCLNKPEARRLPALPKKKSARTTKSWTSTELK